MPAQPSYFHRLGEAIEVFRSLPNEWIDRRLVEETFGVSKTVAWRILRQCGVDRGPGNTLACRREVLIEALERLRQTGRCDQEIRRRERLDSRLTQLLASARSQHIPLTSTGESTELYSTRFRKLPPGIELTPTELRVEFSGVEDFLRKVGAIVFALQNDYEEIADFIESTRG